MFQHCDSTSYLLRESWFSTQPRYARLTKSSPARELKSDGCFSGADCARFVSDRTSVTPPQLYHSFATAVTDQQCVSFQMLKDLLGIPTDHSSCDTTEVAPPQQPQCQDCSNTTLSTTRASLKLLPTIRTSSRGCKCSQVGVVPM